MNNIETPYLTKREQAEVLFFDGEKIEGFNDFIKKLEASFERNNKQDVILDMLNFYEQNSSDRKILQEELGVELSEERQEVLVSRGKEMVSKFNTGEHSLDIIWFINLSVQAWVPIEEFWISIEQIKLLRIVQKEQLLEGCINTVDNWNYDINILAIIYDVSRELQKETPTKFLQLAYDKLLEKENS